MEYRMIAIFMGCLLDACFGDPYRLPHPVCAMGNLITRLEGWLRRIFPVGAKGEMRAGICLVAAVLVVTGLWAGGILAAAYAVHPYAGVAIETVMCYQMMAWKSLKTESMKVYQALAGRDIEKARTAVSMIVGRDTASLDETGITKAAVETVAENTSDGVIAPLLFMVLGGGLGVFFYKAVNTMDSMVGYKNDRYLYFGRAAAKLDDVCNYIPARLSAFLMIAAGFCAQLIDRTFGGGKGIYSGPGGVRIFRRDRYQHKSPNSAQTESVCAGVLGVELAGNASYFGVLHEKPTIGDALRPIEYEDIRRANFLMTGTYVLALVMAAAVFAAARIIR